MSLTLALNRNTLFFERLAPQPNRAGMTNAVWDSTLRHCSYL